MMLRELRYVIMGVFVFTVLIKMRANRFSMGNEWNVEISIDESFVPNKYEPCQYI